MAQRPDDGSIHMARVVGGVVAADRTRGLVAGFLRGLGVAQPALDFDKPYRYASGLDEWGRGGSAGVAIGAALAHRPAGRVSINFQSETALARSPGVLWTAAHHHIPLLTVALRTQGTGGSGTLLRPVRQQPGCSERGTGNARAGARAGLPAGARAGQARRAGVGRAGPGYGPCRAMIGEVLQALGIEYAAAGPADDALSRRTREGIPPACSDRLLP